MCAPVKKKGQRKASALNVYYTIYASQIRTTLPQFQFFRFSRGVRTHDLFIRK